MKIAFLASPRPAAQAALEELTGRYGQTAAADADCIVTIGGDGTALKALHAVLSMPAKPVFAMRTESSVGFLCNPLRTNGLAERLRSTVRLELPVLQAELEETGGVRRVLFGINEIVLVRQLFQEARLDVAVDGEGDPMVITGDGLKLATPLGSTAYNRSLGGPRLPLSSSLLTLTGIAIRHPADWSHVVLSDRAILDVEVVEASHHPVRIETAIDAVPDIRRAQLFCNREREATLLFDRVAQSDSWTAFSRSC